MVIESDSDTESSLTVPDENEEIEPPKKFAQETKE